MKTNWKPSVLPLAALLVIGAVCPACDRGGGGARVEGTETASAVPIGLSTVEYDVSGMTCGGCALAARTAIGRLAGVARVEATYEEGAGFARVEYDPARIDPGEIAAALRELGYTPVARSGS